MGGCLGPKQRRQEVYIEVIQTIHQEVTQMTFQQAQNLDIYQYIKQKLSKKGLLRKLIDNLISHRNKIYDSLNHNYQIVLQSPKIQNKYVGLLIFDQIITGIYRTLNNSSNKHNGTSNDSEEFTNFSNNIKSDVILQPIQNLFNKDKIKNSKNLQYVMQINPMARQIDARFDLIYFNLIIQLIQQVPKMYIRILKSLNNFCINKKNKFNCTQLVWKVLNIIMIKIVKNVSVKENTYTYNLLLQNSKQKFKQYQKAEDVKYFIKLWMQQRQNTNSTPNNKLKLVLSSVEEDQSTFDTIDTQQLIINCIKIISLYFNINISSWNSQFLYDILLDVYDQNQFQLHKLNQFQNIVQSIVLKNDLHVHFFRGLFVQLLEYLSLRLNLRNSRTSGKFINPEQHKKSISLKKDVRLNALKTLRRWVHKKYIDLNQTVAYNSGLLVSSYLQNLTPLDPTNNNQILKQFLKLIRENMQAKSKKIVVSALIQHIKDSQTDYRIRSLIISVMRQLLQDSQILYNFGQDFDYIISLDEHYSKQNQMELLQLMGFIIKILPDIYFNEDSDSNSSEIINFKHRICEFIYTCFEVIVYGSADQYFKYRFLCAIVSFLRAIQMRDNISIAYSFYLELIKWLTMQSSKQPGSKKQIYQENKQKGNTKYFILYLTYEISHILVDQLKVPSIFRSLNQKISASNQSANKLLRQVQNQIILTMQKITSQQKYKESNLTKQQFRFAQIQNQVTNYKIFNKQSFQSTRKIMKNYFASNSCVRRSFDKHVSTMEENDDANSANLNRQPSIYGLNAGNKNSLNNPFGRRDSVYNDSQVGSYREDDKNLKDVINMLNV